MPKQVLLSMLIEAALIALTTILLAQPRSVFSSESPSSRSAATFGGMLFLCITFCWSMIFGCILALNSWTLRI